jgi:hypothetical protein
LAWFWALPDVGQAILGGLALALPLAIGVVILFRSLSPVAGA